ncbi:MAG: DNA primase [Ignavibacteria bacterium]|nr:DNA primase [Ignavibacteria bacterium]
MRIPSEKIDEINNANDIVDVISTYVQVKRRGKNFLALCPFHPDKNPSMNISQEKKVYHCFSCGASGNMFRFVQDIEKISFFEAAQKLASRAGIDIKYNKKEIANYDEYVKLYDISTRAARYFVDSLKNVGGNEGKVVKDYIKKRNLKPGTLTRFGIGYAFNRWDGLLNFFREDDLFTNEELEAAGLIKKRDTEDETAAPSYYDRFRGRLIFPIFNEAGKVVAFGGRQLFEDDKTAKYLNSPETKVYSKSKILYGLNFAKDSIIANNYVIFVEGYMDMISLFQAGVENVVATSGTAMTEEQVKLISRYTKNVIFLFDADSAGIKAAKRGIELILEGGLDLDIVTLPEGDDPDSFISKKGVEEFKNVLFDKKSIINFIGEIYNKENKLNTISQKTDFIKEIISYIGKIPDTIKRALYLKEIASLYGLSENELQNELNRFIKNVKKPSFPQSSVVLPERQKIKTDVERKRIPQEELELIEIFVRGGDDVIGYLESNLEIDFLTTDPILKAVHYFLDEYIHEGRVDPSKALNEIEDEDAQFLITNAVLERDEISPLLKADKNSLIARNSNIKINYMEKAIGVIKKFKIKQLERELEEIKKDRERLSEYIELKRRLDQMIKLDVVN